MGHPLGENRASPADNSGDALRHQRQILDQDACVDRHVVHALLRLLLDDFQHDVGVQVFNLLDPRDAFVDGHGADGHGRVAEDGFADLRNIAAGREVHYCVGAVVHGGVQLLQLFVDIRGHGGVADVGVDLAQRGHADAHRLQLGMVDVGGDDHAPARHLVAHQLGRELLALGHVEHFFRDQALAGVVHLREIAVGVLRLAACDPVGAQLGRAVAVSGMLMAVSAHGGLFPLSKTIIIRRRFYRPRRR